MSEPLPEWMNWQDQLRALQSERDALKAERDVAHAHEKSVRSQIESKIAYLKGETKEWPGPRHHDDYVAVDWLQWVLDAILAQSSSSALAAHDAEVAAQATGVDRASVRVPAEMVRRTIDLLRRDAESIDGEWGSCRSVQEIRASIGGGGMFDEYGQEEVALSDEFDDLVRAQAFRDGQEAT